MSVYCNPNLGRNRTHAVKNNLEVGIIKFLFSYSTAEQLLSNINEAHAFFPMLWWTDAERYTGSITFCF